MTLLAAAVSLSFALVPVGGDKVDALTVGSCAELRRTLVARVKRDYNVERLPSRHDLPE